MRGVDIWLPFVTSKIKQYKATDSKTPSSDAHPWISYVALKTTKGQSCEAMTYRKKNRLFATFKPHQTFQRLSARPD
ncbi:hypothetical protein TOC8172_19490 [Pseudomonas syringae]